MGWVFNPFTGSLDRTDTNTGGPGGPATDVPKLIQTFSTDVSTDIGDLVKVNGSNSVTAIADNTAVEIPNGVFGLVTAKPNATTADVIFVGIQGGYSGFTTGLALYVDTDGTLTHTAPATGTLQQVGFAVSTSEVFLYLQNPIRRAT